MADALVIMDIMDRPWISIVSIDNWDRQWTTRTDYGQQGQNTDNWDRLAEHKLFVIGPHILAGASTKPPAMGCLSKEHIKYDLFNTLIFISKLYSSPA